MKQLKISGLLVASSLLWLSCKPGYQEQLAAVDTTRTIQVAVEKLEPTNEPIPVEATGVVASKAEAMLSFKIGGIIDQLYVEEGGSFKKGQVLARLELVEINAQVTQAQENVNKLMRDQSRIKRLYADTVATLEQVQDISTALEVAEQSLKIAKYNQQYASIVARENGRVLRRLPERGELINPGSPVYQVGFQGRNSSQIIKIGVADKDVIRLQEGDSAHVRFDPYPGQVFGAVVSEIAQASDPRTGVFEVELRLKQSDYVLKNGFIGKLRLFPSRQSAYYKIPMSALVEGDDSQAAIYVPDNETVRKVSVTPAYISDEYFVVDRKSVELKEVITRGAAFAKPGLPVKIPNE